MDVRTAGTGCHATFESLSLNSRPIQTRVIRKDSQVKNLQFGDSPFPRSAFKPAVFDPTFALGADRGAIQLPEKRRD
jgi:hypothetical protein